MSECSAAHLLLRSSAERPSGRPDADLIKIGDADSVVSAVPSVDVTELELPSLCTRRAAGGGAGASASKRVGVMVLFGADELFGVERFGVVDLLGVMDRPSLLFFGVAPEEETDLEGGSLAPPC
mmetsp:Transcript_22504/g.34413  ORF Transcript_22504/g.34413 Transcript_22504/m.34413 type:complete len:124 (-) Transcript_22504:1572-1943(-)